MKKQLVRAAAATILGLSLTTGFAAADTIDTTGPWSSNKAITKIKNTNKVTNTNRLHLKNDNSQRAYTGDAKVYGNTSGGTASTGAAANDNAFDAAVTVNNSSAAANVADVADLTGVAGDISNTGPDSRNLTRFTLENKTTVRNTNNVSVNNNNRQTASSGDASVSHNTTGGDATTGDASNSNSTTLELNVTN